MEGVRSKLRSQVGLGGGSRFQVARKEDFQVRTRRWALRLKFERGCEVESEIVSEVNVRSKLVRLGPQGVSLSERGVLALFRFRQAHRLAFQSGVGSDIGSALAECVIARDDGRIAIFPLRM